jgi:hypothetical protein
MNYYYDLQCQNLIFYFYLKMIIFVLIKMNTLTSARALPVSCIRIAKNPVLLEGDSFIAIWNKWGAGCSAK